LSHPPFILDSCLLVEWADEFPTAPGVDRPQKLADAFTSICADSLTEGEEGRAVTVAEVFVDASLATLRYGEAGVTLASGPRVGPNTLSEILCAGKIRLIVTGADSRPIGLSDLGEAIPPSGQSLRVEKGPRRLHHRCLQQPLPITTTPHPRTPPRRRPRPQEPDLALLVPPSRCRPLARYEARPRKSRPPEKTYRMATNNRATLMAVDRGPSTVKANIVGVSGLLDLRRL
jgi:hypothetical protein